MNDEVDTPDVGCLIALLVSIPLWIAVMLTILYVVTR